MTVLDQHMASKSPRRWRGLHAWLMHKVASPSFQGWASGFFLTRRAARKDAEALFDLVSGFAYSQVLLAIVELDLFPILMDGPQSADGLAARCAISPERMTALCQGGVALNLLARTGDSYTIARLGAATLGVPGLAAMIRHHAVFYRDLEDPVALLRGETSPKLAEFWPYVRGETAKSIGTQEAATYSDLMTQTQALVAEETLRILSMRGITHLMDVGGGTGAFLSAVRAQHGDMDLTVFDLPSVVDPVSGSLRAHRIETIGGSFHDALPKGADAISLVRVLYDHADDTIAALLAKVFEALPPGGQILISEPMAGGATPSRSGDVYFSLYTMAMTTGKSRAPEQISRFLRDAGFETIQTFKSDRPFVTSCLSARKPSA